MTEQQMEAIEKLFPNGAVITFMSAHKKTVETYRYNPGKFIVLDRVYDQARLTVDAQKESEIEERGHEPESWGKDQP